MARIVSPQTILDDLSKILPSEIYEDDQHVYVFAEAILIKLYYNNFREVNYGAKIYEKDEARNTNLLITPYADRSEGFSKFISIIDYLNSRNGGDVKLSHLMNKINLLDNFQNL